MKVKLLTALAGPAGAWSCGEEIELDEAEAARFIEAGIAAPIAEAVETAAISDNIETADAPKRRKRG